VDEVGDAVRFGALWGVDLDNDTWNESPVPYDPWEEAASHWVRIEDKEDVEGGKSGEDEQAAAPPEGCEGVILQTTLQELRANGGITGYLGDAPVAKKKET
jgi:hypothetical protein